MLLGSIFDMEAQKGRIKVEAIWISHDTTLFDVYEDQSHQNIKMNFEKQKHAFQSYLCTCTDKLRLIFP